MFFTAKCVLREGRWHVSVFLSDCGCIVRHRSAIRLFSLPAAGIHPSCLGDTAGIARLLAKTKQPFAPALTQFAPRVRFYGDSFRETANQRRRLQILQTPRGSCHESTSQSRCTVASPTCRSTIYELSPCSPCRCSGD